MKLLTSRPRKTDRRGTTIPEVTFILMWMFPIGIALIDFGHCFMTIHSINAAAQRAARAGVGDTSTTEDVETMAETILEQAINTDAENLVIMVKDAGQFDDPAFEPESITDYSALPDADLATLPSLSLFIVRVEVPYSEVGILGSWFLTDVNLYGQSVMRKE